jgi:hypothetical protein
MVVLPSLILLGVVAVAGTAMIKARQDSSDQLRRAEKVGAAYFSDVADFELRVRRVLTDGKKREPADLKRFIDAALKDPPRLGPPPEGASRSRTYREALKASKTVLDPYRRLSKALGRSIAAEPFVKAADAALHRDPASLAGFLVFESEPLRAEVIPELVRTRDAFRSTKVPKGAEDVAVKVDGALTFAIGQVGVMADRAEDGKSYEFDYGDEYETALQAVKNYAIEVDADLAEAVDRVVGERST